MTDYFNPYVGTAITGNLRSGVDRWLDTEQKRKDREAQLAAAEADRTNRFNDEMSLARFRARLDEDKYNARRKSDFEFQQESYAAPVEGSPEQIIYKQSASGVFATPDMAQEGYDPVERRIPAVEARPAGPLYQNLQMRDEDAREQIILRGDQARQTKATPSGGRVPTGTHRHPKPGDGGQVNTTGMTVDAKRNFDALTKQNQVYQAQADGMEDDNPQLGIITENIRQNTVKAQRLINDPASWSAPPTARPSVRPQTPVAVPTPLPAAQSSSVVTNRVRYALSKGQSPREIQKDIDALTNPHDKQVAQKALDQLAPKP